MKMPDGFRTCPECGRNLDVDFAFCPRCGKALGDPIVFQHVLDEAFERLELVEASASVLKIAALDERLRLLESELEELSSHVEGAGASCR